MNLNIFVILLAQVQTVFAICFPHWINLTLIPYLQLHGRFFCQHFGIGCLKECFQLLFRHLSQELLQEVKNEVVKEESNEEFYKKIEKAENTNLTSDIETALAPTISNDKGVEVLQKAIAKGYNKFKLTTLQMMGVELVEFASKESEKVYYVSEINDFISVYE